MFKILLRIVLVFGYVGIISLKYCYAYDPQIEIDYIGNDKRHIGRANILFPVWYKKSELLYLDAIVNYSYQDSSSQEYSGGLGYRKIFKIGSRKWIFGGYGFYDTRFTPKNNRASQIVTGLEVLGVLGEIRLNWYKAIGETSFSLESSSSGNNAISHDKTNVYFGNLGSNEENEIVLDGIDTELGYHIPKTLINVFAGYYYFSKQDIIEHHGPKTRVEFKPWRWFIVEGEYSHDNNLGSLWHARIGVRFAIISSKLTPSPFSIPAKMVQRPVRDIDVRVEISKKEEISIDPAVQVSTIDELIEAVRQGKNDKKKRHIAIINDIDANNITFSDQLGGSNSVVEGFIIAGVKLTKSSGEITNAQFFRRKISNYTVRQNPDAAALSVNGGNFYVVGAMFPYAKSTKFYNLELANWQVDMTNGGGLTNGSGTGLVAVCESCIIEKVKNTSNINGYQSSGILGIARGSSIIKDNENTGDLLAQGDPTRSTAGIVMFAFDTTKIVKNKNTGNILDNLGAGIVSIVHNNVEVDSNENSGIIRSLPGFLGNASGIVLRARDSAIIKGNNNTNNIESYNAAGIIMYAGNDVQIIGNKNTGVVSGINSAGIVREAFDDAIVTKNVNTGRIIANGDGAAETGSAGIINEIYGRTKATDNINIGRIEGNAAAGIVRKATGGERKTVGGNINKGDVFGDESAGIIRDARIVSVSKNINEGDVSGNNSVGIAQNLIGSVLVPTIIRENTNRSNIVGINSRAIYRFGVIGPQVQVLLNNPPGP